MDKKILKDMFDNLLHIWNKTNYWHPKMKSFIYSQTNGVHIIDLTQTYTQLELVKNELTTLHSTGRKILFISTKLQSRTAFSELAVSWNHYYVSEKWVPGLLTNFKTIKKRIVTYIQLSKDAELWALDILTKKEKAEKMLELEKLDKAFSWVRDMKKLPDAIFVVDSKYESQAVKEAITLWIPVFAIANTNSDPYIVTEAIPANTNSVKSLSYLAESLKVCFSKAPVKKENTPTDKKNIIKPTVKKEAPMKKEQEESDTQK